MNSITLKILSYRILLYFFILYSFNSCRKNDVIISNCNFPTTSSLFGYSYYTVGNQYYYPSYTGQNVILKFDNFSSQKHGIISIDPVQKINYVYDKLTGGNVSSSHTKLIFVDYSSNQSVLMDLNSRNLSVFESGLNQTVSNFSFNEKGTYFVYKVEKHNDFINSLIVIRDTSLQIIDSIKYFKYSNDTWTNIIWINDSILSYSFLNDNNTGVRLLNLRNRQIETIFQNDYLNSKNTITSLMWSPFDNKIYFCDGNNIHKVDIMSKQHNLVLNSCDGKQFVVISQYQSNIILSEIIFRKKVSDTRIDEKHSIYKINLSTLEEERFYE